MRISGFQSFTLSDYPGRPAAIIFTQGCNMACPFCHNGQLIACRPGDLNESEMLTSLHKRSRMLQGVVITGGEPTIQPDLANFCRKVHALNLLVKLDTNGMRPKVIESLIAAKLIDYIAMDIKAPLENADLYATLSGTHIHMENIRQSVQIIATSGVEHHFRTTIVPQLLNEANIVSIERSIPPGSRYIRQVFRPEYARDQNLRQEVATYQESSR